MNYYKMNLNDIIAWCKANNQVEWLKKEAAKTFKTKSGAVRNITFIEIKRDFCLAFMPEIVPVAKNEKKPSMYDVIAAL